MNTQGHRHLWRVVIPFSLLAVFVGAFVHNPFDPVAYTNTATSLLDGKNIYHASDGAVYPPFLYILGALLIGAAESVSGSLPPNHPVALASFVFLGSTATAISYLHGRRTISRRRTCWLIFGLLNPFAFFVTVLFGQMEVAVVLGVVGALYAQRTHQWPLGGFFLSAAAAVKIYPAAIYLIYLARNRTHASEIIAGAVPIVLVTLVGLATYYPDSLGIFTRGGGVRPVNLLAIVSGGGLPDGAVKASFIVVFGLATLLGAATTLDKDIALVLPTVPVALLYPNLIEYRWLPLVIAAAYLWVSHESVEIAAGARIVAVVGTFIGSVSMSAGALQGSQQGVPWLVGSVYPLPTLPTLLSINQYWMVRKVMAVIFAVAVVWAAFGLVRQRVLFRGTVLAWTGLVQNPANRIVA